METYTLIVRETIDGLPWFTLTEKPDATLDECEMESERRTQDKTILDYSYGEESHYRNWILLEPETGLRVNVCYWPNV